MPEVKLTPQLRFAEFSEKWNKKVIADISDKITDGTHDTPKPTKEGVPYLTAIHVRDGFIDFDNCYYLPKDEHDKIYKRCNPEFGDLLMVNIGAGTANSAIVNVNYEFSLKNVALIKPNKSLINPNFFAQIQRKNSKRLHHQISSGGAQPFLALKQIAKLKLTIPENLNEQTKIASFLSSVDKKIKFLQQKKDLLEQYKKGVMQQIFSQQIRFKDDDGNDYPDWEEKKLGQLVKFLKGKGLPKSEISDEGKYKCIHYGELFTKYNELIDNVISRTNNVEKAILSVENDVLMPTSDVTPNGLATASCLKESNVILGGDVLIIRQNEKRIEGVYLSYYIRHFRNDVMRLVSGSTVYHLYGSDMKNLKVLIPCLLEQEQIANFLSAIDDKIELINRQIKNTQEFKKGLLQQMFV